MNEAAEEPGVRHDGLLEHERKYLEEARWARARLSGRGKWRPTDPQLISARGDVCGMALSGGGLRSTTFNLGLLQGLHQLGLLKMFDYLATVSGGGYVGGFWTAWRHYHRQPDAPASHQTPQLFPASEQGARGAQLEEVRHLRELSNLLGPRPGLRSLDMRQLTATVLGALIPTLPAALAFILLAHLLWLLLASALFATVGPLPRRLLVSGGLMMLLTSGGLLLSEWLRSRQERQAKVSRGLPPEAWAQGPSGFGDYLPPMLLATGLVLVLWAWLIPGLPHGPWKLAGPAPETGGLHPRPLLHVFCPAGAWLGAAGLLVTLRWLGSRFMTPWMQSTTLAALDRVIRRLLQLAILWSFFAAFWMAGWLLHDYSRTNKLWLGIGGYEDLLKPLVGTVTALTALFARAQKLLGRRASEPVSPNLKDRAKSRIPQVLAAVILSLIAFGMVLLILTAADQHWLGWLMTGAGAITVLMLLFFDPNLMGLHVFYRARLARTFIGAAHGEAPGQLEPHSKDDLPINRLRSLPGPLHLICCAANDLSSVDPLASRDRGADSAVLSPVSFSVGSEWRSWRDIREEGGLVPTLAAAMTASGAAFQSRLGSMPMRQGPAVSFLMTAFNLRLGLWVPHPTRSRGQWYDRMLVGLPFYKELLGRSRARGQEVLLSDGGYFDNLGLYELVRRHCRFILVSDCGMDSDTGFDDLANAVRRVREDFGVEIRIDVSPLRANAESGLSRQPIVVGDIEYPDGDTGMMLLLTPTLTGNEPPDITQYKARNADFPHETTGDRFYDEAQWEAYRRLGEHVALTVFGPLRGTADEYDPSVARLFNRARSEWLPMPDGYEECFSRFAARTAELDAMLQREDAGRLSHEVFKEVGEMDLAAKKQVRMHERMPRRTRWRRPTEDEDAEARNPSPRELSEALRLLQRALRTMEEVYLAGELATHYNHPAYRGVMNYFARWTHSTLFRAWWPLLKTLGSPRFTHFLEQRFNLPKMSRADVGRLSTAEHGFAMSSWMYQGGRSARDETPEGEYVPGQRPIERLISYQLRMPGTSYSIQAAQLIARTHNSETGKPLFWDIDGGGGRQVLVWPSDNFYVPPGLRGVGIREDFLRQLTSSPALLDQRIFGGESAFSRGMLLVVRILVDRDASAARRNEWADEVQFYRAQGFEEPGPELEQWLCTVIDRELNLYPALPWARREDEHWLPYWLVRTYDPLVWMNENEGAPSASEAGEHEGPALH